MFLPKKGDSERAGRRQRGVVSAIATEPDAPDDVIARTMSCDCMFDARIASAFPPRADQPDVADFQYRGKLGWSGGKSAEIGKSGRRGRRGGWVEWGER